jgi:hypothetical protein
VSGRKPVATVPAAAVPAAAATVLAATAHALAGVRIRSTGGAKPVAKRTVWLMCSSCFGACSSTFAFNSGGCCFGAERAKTGGCCFDACSSNR